MKCLFLDRDGVINVDSGYVIKWDEYNFIEGVFEAIKIFISFGFHVVIVTNQSGIARGYFSEEDFLNLSNKIDQEFKKNGINILDVFYCPHYPSLEYNNPYSCKCDCRKPEPGLLKKAIKKYNFKIEDSIMVGDKLSDIFAGKNAGVGKLVLLRSNDESDLNLSGLNGVEKFNSLIDFARSYEAENA